ncbi:unnamed protein product [Camellia sinensis]
MARHLSSSVKFLTPSVANGISLSINLRRETRGGGRREEKRREEEKGRGRGRGGEEEKGRGRGGEGANKLGKEGGGGAARGGAELLRGDATTRRATSFELLQGDAGRRASSPRFLFFPALFSLSPPLSLSLSGHSGGYSSTKTLF